MKLAKGKKLGAGRVAFLARIDSLKEKVNAGHTLASVYEEYQEQLGISYSQFARYVARYITGEEKKEKEVISKKPEAPRNEGFAMDTKLNKEDLY